MGSPCDYLIPAAILYRNSQGLTAEEFITQLKKIGGRKEKYSLDHSDYFQNKFYSLAWILDLKKSLEYIEKQKAEFDRELNYYKKKEIMLFKGHYSPKEEVKIIRESRKALGEFISDEVISCFLGNKGYEKGDYIDTKYLTIPEEYDAPNIDIQAEDILETKTEEDFADDFENLTEQKIKVKAVEVKIQEEKFSSINKLIKKYPEYSAERMYDFSQEEGFLFPSGTREDKTFKWIRNKGRYFLNLKWVKEHISLQSYYTNKDCNWIHEKEEGQKFSLTDLVLTAEAIRRKDWKILEYNGFYKKDVAEWIYSDSKTIKEYEKAVFDTEMSAWARKENWTNLEFLRRYLE
jgi:hypothetical protein